MTLDPTKSVYVERQGLLVATIELISPRNKDRPVARATYLARYVRYLLEGVHLLLVDVHPRPVGVSFADQIAQELQISQPPCLPPMGVSYRVGEPADIGSALPSMELPLTVQASIQVDLESTYSRAVAAAYL
jgi:hypothetical protein